MVLAGGYWAEEPYLPQVIWHCQIALLLMSMRAAAPEPWPSCWQLRGPCSFPAQRVKKAQSGPKWPVIETSPGAAGKNSTANPCKSTGRSRLAWLCPESTTDFSLQWVVRFNTALLLAVSSSLGFAIEWQLLGRIWWRKLSILSVVSILPEFSRHLNPSTVGWFHSKLVWGWESIFEGKR